MPAIVPIVLEHEPDGTVSAYVIGLPGVFAAADTEAAATPAIRRALAAHLSAFHTSPARSRLQQTTLRLSERNEPTATTRPVHVARSDG
jgi:hypothetical protein